MAQGNVINSRIEIKIILDTLMSSRAMFNFLIKGHKEIYSTYIIKMDKEYVYFDIQQEDKINNISAKSTLSFIAKYNGCKIIIKDTPIILEYSYLKIKIPENIYHNEKRDFYRIRPIKKKPNQVNVIKNDRLLYKNTCEILDISKKGVKIKTNKKIPEGVFYIFIFDHKNQRIKSEIRWSSVNEKDNVYIYGMKFNEDDISNRKLSSDFFQYIQKEISETLSSRLRIEF